MYSLTLNTLTVTLRDRSGGRAVVVIPPIPVPFLEATPEASCARN